MPTHRRERIPAEHARAFLGFYSAMNFRRLSYFLLRVTHFDISIKIAKMHDVATLGEVNRMKVMKAKDLKNRTGEALRLVRQGEKIMITVHGKPRAILSPAETVDLPEEQVKPEEAWKGIEEALKRSKPRFESWQEAMNWSRRGR